MKQEQSELEIFAPNRINVCYFLNPFDLYKNYKKKIQQYNEQEKQDARKQEASSEKLVNFVVLGLKPLRNKKS